MNKSPHNQTQEVTNGQTIAVENLEDVSSKDTEELEAVKPEGLKEKAKETAAVIGGKTLEGAKYLTVQVVKGTRYLIAGALTGVSIGIQKTYKWGKEKKEKAVEWNERRKQKNENKEVKGEIPQIEIPAVNEEDLDTTKVPTTENQNITLDQQKAGDSNQENSNEKPQPEERGARKYETLEAYNNMSDRGRAILANALKKAIENDTRPDKNLQEIIEIAKRGYKPRPKEERKIFASLLSILGKGIRSKIFWTILGISLAGGGIYKGCYSGKSKVSTQAKAKKNDVDFKDGPAPKDYKTGFGSLCQYEKHIDHVSKKYNVPRDIIAAIAKHESMGRYYARGPASDTGLAQLTPAGYKTICLSNEKKVEKKEKSEKNSGPKKWQITPKMKGYKKYCQHRRQIIRRRRWEIKKVFDDCRSNTENKAQAYKCMIKADIRFNPYWSLDFIGRLLSYEYHEYYRTIKKPNLQKDDIKKKYKTTIKDKEICGGNQSCTIYPWNPAIQAYNKGIYGEEILKKEGYMSKAIYSIFGKRRKKISTEKLIAALKKNKGSLLRTPPNSIVSKKPYVPKVEKSRKKYLLKKRKGCKRGKLKAQNNWVRMPHDKKWGW